MSVALEELTMNNDTLKVIERNTGRITRKVLQEIRSRPGAGHYSAVPDEVVSERISRVIGNVHRRLGTWLGKAGPKGLLFAGISDLAALRCRECMPFEEVAAVLLMIRKEICGVIGAGKGADRATAGERPAELGYYVNLLFVGMIQSVIAGYRNELAVVPLRQGSERLLTAKALRI